jgi:hypothetical protein
VRRPSAEAISGSLPKPWNLSPSIFASIATALPGQVSKRSIRGMSRAIVMSETRPAPTFWMNQVRASGATQCGQARFTRSVDNGEKAMSSFSFGSSPERSRAPADRTQPAPNFVDSSRTSIRRVAGSIDR